MRVVDTSAWLEWLSDTALGRKVGSELPEGPEWIVPTIVQFELSRCLTLRSLRRGRRSDDRFLDPMRGYSHWIRGLRSARRNSRKIIRCRWLTRSSTQPLSRRTPTFSPATHTSPTCRVSRISPKVRNEATALRRSLMADAPRRLVSAEKRPEDDAALRPQVLADFTGQEAARNNLKVFIEFGQSARRGAGPRAVRRAAGPRQNDARPDRGA